FDPLAGLLVLGRLVDRNGEAGHRPAVGRVPQLGITPEVADDLDLAKRHRPTPAQSIAAGAASLSDSSIRSRPSSSSSSSFADGSGASSTSVPAPEPRLARAGRSWRTTR